MSGRRATPTFPFVGRRAEAERLVAAVEGSTTSGGRGRAAVVVGPAGVGKSRLVQEALVALVERGFEPVVVAGSPALAEVPFGVFREILPPFDDQVGSWLRVLREGTERLQAAAGAGSPLLVVEDVHDLDPGSVALILHVLDVGVIPFVGTLRAETELAPHVVDMLKRCWGDQLADRIDLGPLGRAGVADLATAVLGAPPDSVSVERLWGWTGGNPLLLWHALSDGSTDGSFDARAGVWQLEPGPIGPEVAAAVERVLGTVDDDVRRVARLVAESDGLPLAVVDAVAGADAVERAEEAGIIVATGGARDGTCRLRHPLYGDVLRASETDEDRQRIRSDLATAMIGAAGSIDAVAPADRVLLALWYVDQRDLGADAQRVLLDAAAHLLHSWQHRAALRFAEPVWRETESLEAGLILCRAFDAIGLDADACVVARRLLDHASDDMQRMIATIQLAGAEHRRSGTVDRSRAIIEATIAGLTDHDTELWTNGLLIYLATILMHDGRFDEARDIVEPIAAQGDDIGETIAVVGPIGAAQGRTTATLAAVAPIVATMARGRRLYAAHAWLVSVIEGLNLLEAGRIGPARAVLQPVHDHAVASGDVEIVAWSALQLARASLLEGTDLEVAVHHFRDSAAAFGEIVRPGYAAWALGGLAGALALHGDGEGAAQAAAAFDRLPPHPVRLYEGDATRARAWADAEGAIELAARRIDEAARAARTTQQWAIEAACLHDLVRLRVDADTDDVSSRAAELAARAEVDSPLVAARLLHIGAIATRDDAAAFEAAARAFALLGVRRFAAEAWAGAARAHDLGPSPDHRAATRAVLRTRASMGPAPATPLLSELPSIRLTDRQLEIARLAARGMSRKAIAEQGYVSRRTVDRHLVDVFGALGVRASGELAEALADLAAAPPDDA